MQDLIQYANTAATIASMIIVAVITSGVVGLTLGKFIFGTEDDK